MNQYPIAAWYYLGLNRPPEEKVDLWHELGLNLVTLSYTLDQKDRVLRALDRAQLYDMKLILMDPRTSFLVLHEKGEEKYREGVRNAVAEYGSHPALFGFAVGDEPDAACAEAAFRAVRIHEELAPHLHAFLNLLPWFDWIGERMGTEAYAPYLDRACRESHAKLLGFDCYTQMNPDADAGLTSYFYNLREHMESFQRNGTPFVCTVLCSGHYRYRCPSEDDLRWQLSTAVAHGAAAVMWFHIELDPREDTFRNAPVNRLGDKTEDFIRMRTVNLEFQNQMGKIMRTLKIEKCFHVGKAYGGMPLFRPFGSILSVSADAPLILSSFLNREEERFYVVCSNTPQKPTYVSLCVKDDVQISKCFWGNVFYAVPQLQDAVGENQRKSGQSFGFFLNPGQMILLKETKGRP